MHAREIRNLREQCAGAAAFTKARARHTRHVLLLAQTKYVYALRSDAFFNVRARIRAMPPARRTATGKHQTCVLMTTGGCCPMYIVRPRWKRKVEERARWKQAWTERMQNTILDSDLVHVCTHVCMYARWKIAALNASGTLGTSLELHPFSGDLGLSSDKRYIPRCYQVIYGVRRVIEMSRRPWKSKPQIQAVYWSAKIREDLRSMAR